jgi:hypothetical protein
VESVSGWMLSTKVAFYELLIENKETIHLTKYQLKNYLQGLKKNYDEKYKEIVYYINGGGHGSCISILIEDFVELKKEFLDKHLRDALKSKKKEKINAILEIAVDRLIRINPDLLKEVQELDLFEGNERTHMNGLIGFLTEEKSAKGMLQQEQKHKAYYKIIRVLHFLGHDTEENVKKLLKEIRLLKNPTKRSKSSRMEDYIHIAYTSGVIENKDYLVELYNYYLKRSSFRALQCTLLLKDQDKIKEVMKHLESVVNRDKIKGDDTT